MKAPHPYEAHNKISAYPNDDGTYRIHGKTYSVRETLKANGARWNPENKTWTGSLEAAKAVNAYIMTRVRVASHCHESEKVIFATHKEVEAGCIRLGCSLCDTIAICGDTVPILEVLREPDRLP